MKRTYKYLLKPNIEQKKKITVIFGAVRFVHNRYLDDLRSGKYTKSLAKDILKEYKEQYPFLNKIESSILMNVLFQAQDKKDILKAYRRRNSSYETFTISNLQRRPIYIEDGSKVHIPSLGLIEFVYHRPLPADSQILKSTIARHPDGEYYICIVVETDRWLTSSVIDPVNSIGLDYSSPHLYVDSNGYRADMPHFYKKKEHKIAALDKKLRQCVKESSNYYKYKVQRAKLFARIKNQRSDYLHKLSNDLTNKYDIICVEDLDMKQISGNMDLGKRTFDNAYGMFVEMLKYKSREKGKLLLTTDKYFPSSKLCSRCGSLHQKLTLNERIWQCPNCGATLDRDINAAINIRNKCLDDRYGRRVFD